MNMRLYIILLLLVSLTFAQSSTQGASGTMPEPFTGTLIVEKSAPESVSMGQAFDITILVTNQGSQSAQGFVYEYLGNVEPVSPIPKYAEIENESILAAVPPVIIFNLSMSPGTSETFEYTVKPKSVGALSIGPTQVIVPGAKFLSNSLVVQVNCTESASCDESIGETPTNCPSKCGGSANVTPPEAPELAVIPTAEYVPPSDPKSEPPPQSEIDQVQQGQMMLIGAIILIVIAAVVYYFYFMKKK